ncbi:MAG TPA: ABC transporter substrate-binding protein [Gallionella sp.]|nr:ABC transporter substrate-binding protein [Gallionella sp.]
MKNTAKKLSWLLGALALLQLTAPVAQAEEKPKEIRIAFSGAGAGGRPLAGGSSLATAHLRGALEEEFKKDGIKIKWYFNVGAGPATNEQFANKLIDFASHGDLPLIVGRSTGLRHKLILGQGRFGETTFVVPANSEAKTLADLKGKKIGVTKGTSGQLTLNRVLERNGFTERDFKLVSLDAATIKAALATGDIDGALTTPYDLIARGVAKILFKIDRDSTLTSVSNFWVGEEFEKKYPDLVQRVVTAIVKEAKWSSDENNRTELLKMWARQGTTTYLDYAESWKAYKLKERVSPLLDEYYVNRIQKSIDEVKHFKLARRDVDINGWIEPKYLNVALKELKLEHYWDEYDKDGNIKK